MNEIRQTGIWDNYPLKWPIKTLMLDYPFYLENRRGLILHFGFPWIIHLHQGRERAKIRTDEREKSIVRVRYLRRLCHEAKDYALSDF